MTDDLARRIAQLEKRLDMLEAQITVDNFADLLLQRYGLQDADVREILADVRWLRGHHEQWSSITNKIGATFIALLVGGVVLATWEGIKHFLHLK